MEITTPRLLLREFVEQDSTAFMAYQADSRVRQFSAPDEGDATALAALVPLFVRWAAEEPRRNWQLAIAERTRTSGLIGSVGLRSSGASAGTVDFGLELAPAYWGQGLGAEAARALLEWGFTALPIVAVHGTTVSGNTRVAALVRRLGFRVVHEHDGPVWLATRDWREQRWELPREAWMKAGG